MVKKMKSVKDKMIFFIYDPTRSSPNRMKNRYIKWNYNKWNYNKWNYNIEEQLSEMRAENKISKR